MTRLSALHAYPAMMNDELVHSLVNQYVYEGAKFLDPFCGSGKIVTAADQAGANVVAVDINPLARLITAAKLGNPSLKWLNNFRNRAERWLGKSRAKPVERDLMPGRQVSWFGKDARLGLERLIDCINSATPPSDERLLLAVILSATARDVSYMSKRQWKLHRQLPERRDRELEAKRIFLSRLTAAIAEMASSENGSGTGQVIAGDVRELRSAFWKNRTYRKFDIVITSPPYGDSQTTVQYGAASGLLLGVIRHINGFDGQFLEGGEIDRMCIGGSKNDRASTLNVDDIRRYWRGSVSGSGFPRIYAFLGDMRRSIREIAESMRFQGKIVFVVGNRTVSQWYVHLDRFVEDEMLKAGFHLESKETNTLKQKWQPFKINRFGRSTQMRKSDSALVSTLKSEKILVFG